MKKMVPRAALMMAQNARDRLGYYQREMNTLLHKADLILALLRKIPPGDYTQQALFLEGDEILAERARMKNCLADAKIQLEVAETAAREDAIWIDENGGKNEFGFSN